MLHEQFESAVSQHACARTMDQQCRLVQPLQHQSALTGFSGNMNVCSELFLSLLINQA